MFRSSNNGKVIGDCRQSPQTNMFSHVSKPFLYPTKHYTEMLANPQGNSNGNDVNKVEEVAYIGPTRLPVNTRVWSSISSYMLEDIARAPKPTAPAHSQMVNQLPSNGKPPTDASQLQTHFNSCSVRPVLLASGVIQLRLPHSIQVEITLDGSVKVINELKNITIAISSNATAVALNHPNGVVFQNGPRVDIAAYDAKRQNNFIRWAKMWHKGISLTSEGCALIYLVDTAGTRTTSDMITMDLHSDYVNQVFLNGFVSGTQNKEMLFHALRTSSCQLGLEGSLVYYINNIRITQSSDGLVKIQHTTNHSTIRTSPTNGSVAVTTSRIHCTASLGETSHLFVRCDDRRMHFDGSTFIVRNVGHSAGFDDCNRLRVY